MRLTIDIKNRNNEEDIKIPEISFQSSTLFDDATFLVIRSENTKLKGIEINAANAINRLYSPNPSTPSTFAIIIAVMTLNSKSENIIAVA